MLSLTISVWIAVAISMVNGDKTEQEWITALEQMINNFTTAYNSMDILGMRGTRSKNLHRFSPGRKLVIGFDDVVITHKGKLSNKLDGIRWHCGNQVVIEISYTFEMKQNGQLYGKYMSHVVDGADGLKVHSEGWTEPTYQVQ